MVLYVETPKLLTIFYIFMLNINYLTPLPICRKAYEVWVEASYSLSVIKCWLMQVCIIMLRRDLFLAKSDHLYIHTVATRLALWRSVAIFSKTECQVLFNKFTAITEILWSIWELLPSLPASFVESVTVFFKKAATTTTQRERGNECKRETDSISNYMWCPCSDSCLNVANSSSLYGDYGGLT